MSARPRHANGSATVGRRARIAAIHAVAGRRCVVVLAAGDPPQLLDSADLAAGDDEALRALLRRHRPTRVVRVVPAGETVVRTTGAELPEDADPEARASALRLIAEAELPFVPPHRLAAGVVPAGGRARSTLLTGWPEREGSVANAAFGQGVEDSWIAEPAALASLAPLAGSIRAFADPATGSIAVVASGREGVRVRALVGDPTDEATWRDEIARLVQDADLAAGAPDPGAFEVHVTRPTLVLAPAERELLRERVEGLPRGLDWFDTCAVPLGAALAAASDDPLVRSLATLSASPPRARTSPFETISAWLRSPARAAAIVVVSLLAMLLAPWASAWARTAALRADLEAIGANEEDADVALRAALYEQLEDVRWNMTKLLADVAAATPVGVRAESIRIDRRQGLRVSCTADSGLLITDFQRNLASLGVFQGVSPEQIESGGAGGVEAIITADVARPHLRAQWPEDFAETPLAVRLHGEGASNDRFESGGSSSGGSRARTPIPRTRAARHADSDDDDGDRRLLPEREIGASASDVPPALSDEEIEAMDRGTAMRQWGERKRYLGANSDAPPDVRARIEKEIEKLQAQFTGGGG